jgi:hypothetical protein
MKIHRIIVSAAVLALCALASLAQSGAILATGTFHGAAHKTSGRVTVCQAPGGNVLRLTHFSPSNGPNVHVLLIAAADAKDDENFLTENVDRIDLGPLKGNESDQNYVIPSRTDLAEYQSVAIFCERFNANFGTAPLEK